MMKNISEYLIVVSPLADEDGGGFVAHVPDLPGCFGDGETRSEAISDAEKAAIEWIDEYEKMGREVPAPGSMEAEIRARRSDEIKSLTALRDRLRETEKDYESLDARLSNIESDIQHLLDLLDNEKAWERFNIITKTIKSQQQELFC